MFIPSNVYISDVLLVGHDKLYYNINSKYMGNQDNSICYGRPKDITCEGNSASCFLQDIIFSGSYFLHSDLLCLILIIIMDLNSADTSHMTSIQNGREQMAFSPTWLGGKKEHVGIMVYSVDSIMQLWPSNEGDI